MSLPIPARVGHWFLYDTVLTNRCYHALGLANVFIVVLALSRAKLAAPGRNAGGICLPLRGLLAGHAFAAFGAVNDAIGIFYSLRGHRGGGGLCGLAGGLHHRALEKGVGGLRAVAGNRRHGADQSRCKGICTSSRNRRSSVLPGSIRIAGAASGSSTPKGCRGPAS